MRPPISRTSTPSSSNPIANWLAGLVTEVDFNSVPHGYPINTHFSSFGVTFRAIPLKRKNVPTYFGDVIAVPFNSTHPQDDPKDTSPQRWENLVISINNYGRAFNEETDGGILATFDSPQQYVSIDAFAHIDTGQHPKPVSEYNKPGDNKPVMVVYGVPIKLLDGKQLPAPLLLTVNFPLNNLDPKFESWQTLEYLSLSPTTNIGSILLTSTSGGLGPSVSAVFDRLRFTDQLPMTGTFVVG